MLNKKRCSRCNKVKRSSEFSKNRRNTTGLHGCCKICQSKRHEEMKKRKPWMISYRNARKRCLDKNHFMYKHYGARGIKLVMSIKDFEELWFRDKAHLMKLASMDRINPDGDYTKQNCHYIEFKENAGKKGKYGRLK